MASGIWKIFGTKGAESAQNQWIEPLAAAHNPEVEGSNPPPATIKVPHSVGMRYFFHFFDHLFFAFLTLF